LYSANHYAQDSDSPNKKIACRQRNVISDGEKNWDGVLNDLQVERGAAKWN